MPPPRGTNRTYEPKLDALRAFAVLAVAWSHWAPNHQYGIPFGFGVHLFFVLSGYLITGILLDIRAMRHRLHGIGIFFARRILRIFPAYYVTLALALLGGISVVRDTWPWHVTYMSNVLAFARSEWPGPASHWWSLAVEEQFYIAWPWLIVFLRQSLLAPLIMTAVILAPVCRAWLTAAGHPVEFAMVLTPSSLDCLGAGALLALARSSGSGLTRPMLYVAGAATVGIAASIALWPSAATAMSAMQTVAAVGFAWVVWKVSRDFHRRGRTLLEAGPVVYLGRISYGFYLIHNFAFLILGGLLAHFQMAPTTLWPPLRLLLLFGVTMTLAAASWHGMEKPLNDAKRFLPYRDESGSQPHVRLAASS